jgi:putative membrane protein
MAGLIGLLIGTVIVGLIGGFLIWILSNLGWGLRVDGFGAAFISAIVIAIVSNVVIWLLGSLGLLVANVGLFGAIINLIVSAVILLIADNFVAGLKVNGFGGAIIAAIGFGVLQWLASLIAGFFS